MALAGEHGLISPNTGFPTRKMVQIRIGYNQTVCGHLQRCAPALAPSSSTVLQRSLPPLHQVLTARRGGTFLSFSEYLLMPLHVEGAEAMG